MEREYVLITGASSGIGETIALNLAKSYNVILHGRNLERLQEVRSLCAGANHFIWSYDLSQINELENALQKFLAEKQIRISFLVHCAGTFKLYPLKMVTSELLEKTFAVNVFSAEMLVKILVGKKYNDKALKSVVFISSNISNFGGKALSVYSAAKSGLDGLMRSLAMELAPAVRLNSVLPGAMRTPMTEKIYQNTEIAERMTRTYPLGEGNPVCISDAVEFLLSERARWITGQQLTVDGGRTVNLTA